MEDREMRVSAILALCLAGCAQTYQVGTATVPTPPGCVAFAEPTQVVCSSPDSRTAFGVPARVLCELSEPHRWVVTAPSGKSLTVVGGSCFTLLEGSAE